MIAFVKAYRGPINRPVMSGEMAGLTQILIEISRYLSKDTNNL